ncbi:MAG: transketolase [Bdellovibrionales bacterium]|nr:transketolase [Bdellovibrionales bacterium]
MTTPQSVSGDQEIALLAKTIRVLSAEAVDRANSGHPGMPMGAADYAAVLWSDFLRFDPKDPEWLGRDRFVLSAGHGSMLLYSLLHLFGYDLSLDEIKNFRQWESRTPGHPEFGLTPGVETTTGPLGQGLSNGVGLALSEKLLAETYSSELFGSRIFGIVSDGDLMEGVASEAASLAGHLQLGNITYIYDDNHISIGGSTDVCFTESVAKRFEAYGWHVQKCDGHNLGEIRACLNAAVAETGKPSIICARTTIGLGSPNKQNTADVHGSPLGASELQLAKKELGWGYEGDFFVPEEVRTFCRGRVEEKGREKIAWNAAFGKWRDSHREKSAQLEAQRSRAIPQALTEELCSELGKITDKKATRELSGNAIQIIAKHMPGFIGGSADLEPSNKTLIKNSSDITAESFSGRNIRFGVREHGMGAIVNGLAYTKSWIPYGATFLVFADYNRPTIRLAALSHLQSLFIFTHDSFWVGEDGPTHEPIEHIQSLRIIPNLDVYRPADGLETAMCYLMALESTNRPSALLFTRQGLPVLERPTGFQREQIKQGAYVVANGDQADRVIVATGSEVWVAAAAAKILAEKGTPFRVVSAPCLEAYYRLSKSEREAIIPPKARVVSLEAGITSGWYDIVGKDGLALGIDHYGASAPGEVLAEKFGFTPESVVQRVGEWF